MAGKGVMFDITNLLMDLRKEKIPSFGEIKDLSRHPEKYADDWYYGVEIDPETKKIKLGLLNITKNPSGNPLSGDDKMGIIDTPWTVLGPIAGPAIGIADERMGEADIFGGAVVAGGIKDFSRPVSDFIYAFALTKMLKGEGVPEDIRQYLEGMRPELDAHRQSLDNLTNGLQELRDRDEEKYQDMLNRISEAKDEIRGIEDEIDKLPEDLKKEFEKYFIPEKYHSRVPYTTGVDGKYLIEALKLMKDACEGKISEEKYQDLLNEHKDLNKKHMTYAIDAERGIADLSEDLARYKTLDIFWKALLNSKNEGGLK